MKQASQSFGEPAFKQTVREVVEEVTKPQFESFKTDMLAAMRSMVQEFKNDVANIKDEIVTELQTSREEKEVEKSLHPRLINLEDEVDQLKRIHQQGTHSL